MWWSRALAPSAARVTCRLLLVVLVLILIFILLLRHRRRRLGGVAIVGIRAHVNIFVLHFFPYEYEPSHVGSFYSRPLESKNKPTCGLKTSIPPQPPLHHCESGNRGEDEQCQYSHSLMSVPFCSFFASPPGERHEQGATCTTRSARWPARGRVRTRCRRSGGRAASSGCGRHPR